MGNSLILLLHKGPDGVLNCLPTRRKIILRLLVTVVAVHVDLVTSCAEVFSRHDTGERAH